LAGDVFYQGVADAGEDGSAVVFASVKQLETLRSATKVYFDATFKVVPATYYQLFTVFVQHVDATFPVIYALMTRKTHSLYVAVFQKIKGLVPDFQPTSAMADFEEASVSAFREVFGNVVVSGCWFHYAQSIVKRLQKVGLKQPYRHDANVQSTVHCLLGLPLLPPADIVDALADVTEAVNSSSQFAGQLLQLTGYWLRFGPS